MDTISIPLNPSTEDIESLRTLFNKHSVENKGVLSREELNLLVISLANKPPAYEIMEFYGSNPGYDTTGIDVNSFLVWYLSFNLGAPRLANIYAGLRRLEKEVETAAPHQADKQTIKESYLKFSSENNETVLNNQVYFDLLLNPTKTKSRLLKYQQILKKEINPFALVLNFHIDANPGELKDKVETAINQLKELAMEMIGPAAGLLDLINIQVGNNDGEIIIVIESDFIVFKLLAEEFDRVMNLVSPNIHAEMSLLIRANTVSKILANAAQGLGASVTYDLKIDSILLQRIKELIFKANEIPESIKTIFAYLFEQIRLEIKTNNIKDQLIETFGLPNVNIQDQMGGIKQQVNVPEIIDNFLPPSCKQLVKIVKGAESTNVTADLFLGCFNFRANFALAGTNEVFESIL